MTCLFWIANMCKVNKAKLVLIQIEELQVAEDTNLSGMLVIVNEILRDAKQLAEQTLEDEAKAA